MEGDTLIMTAEQVIRRFVKEMYKYRFNIYDVNYVPKSPASQRDIEILITKTVAALLTEESNSDERA